MTIMNMIYWKVDEFWVGKLLDHPEIVSQGKTVEDLEANLREAYLLIAMEDVPEEHSIKPIPILSAGLSAIPISKSDETQTIDDLRQSATTILCDEPSAVLQNEDNLQISEPHVSDTDGIGIIYEQTGKFEEFYYAPKTVRAFLRKDAYYYIVLKGSTAAGDSELANSFPSPYKDFRLALISSGALVPNDRGNLVFTKDVNFTDRSTPASIVSGDSRSGNDSWKRYMVCEKQEGIWQGRLTICGRQERAESLEILVKRLRDWAQATATLP